MSGEIMFEITIKIDEKVRRDLGIPKYLGTYNLKKYMWLFKLTYAQFKKYIPMTIEELLDDEFNFNSE